MATLASVLRQAGYVTPQGQVTGPRTDLAQKLKSYVMSIPQNAAQNLANQRADIDAALTMGQGGIQIGDRAAFERQMAQVPNLMGLTAYHGTPHTIKGKFDISKVGTGEGAQAYGHGMYFAEAPDVAKTYMTVGGKGEFVRLGDKVVPTASQEGQLLADVNKLGRKAAINKYPDQADLIKTINPDQIKFEGGNLYKVDIPDEYIPNMLDWDNPVTEEMRKRISDATMKSFGSGATGTSGEKLYKEIVFEMRRNGSKTPEADAAKWLNEQGIKGIRYLDEGSRGMRHKVQVFDKNNKLEVENLFPTEDMARTYIAQREKQGFTTKLSEVDKKRTSNFVVFDPSEVKILEQNSKPMTRKEIIEQELEKVAK